MSWARPFIPRMLITRRGISVFSVMLRMAVCLVLVYSLPSIIWSVSSVLSTTAELVTLMSELATKWSKVVASAVMSNVWIQLVLIWLIYDAAVYVLQSQFQPESIVLNALSLPGPIKYLCLVLTAAELLLGIWLLSIAMGMMLVYIVLIFVLAVMVYRILRTVRRNGSFNCWVIWDQVRSDTRLLLLILVLVILATAECNECALFHLWSELNANNLDFIPGPIKYLCLVLTAAELWLGIWLLSIAMGMMLVYIVLTFVLAVMVYRILRTVRRNGSFTCWVIWDQVRSGTYLLLELLELVVAVTAMLNILVLFLLWSATKWLVVIWSATIWSATKRSATAACRWSATIWSTVKWLSAPRSASSPVPLVSSWP